VLEGFGLRELLDDWSGYHIGLQQSPTGLVAVLAESTVLEGTGVEALEQHDRRRAAEHERRRRGDLDDATRPERVITRTQENVQRHLATHLAAHAHDAVAAAMLRHLAKEGR
jgi:hypothetical protein